MSQPSIVRTPRDSTELALILTQRPPAWEYLYFAGVLRLERDALDPKLHDTEMHFATPTGERIEDSQAIGRMGQALDDIRDRVESLTALFEPEVQQRAFGAPGQPGDPDRIRHLAERWTATYAGMLDWAVRLRGARKSATFRQLFELEARLIDGPARTYYDFVDGFVRRLDESLPRIANGEPVDLQLSLTFIIDEDAVEAISAEMERVGMEMSGR